MSDKKFSEWDFFEEEYFGNMIMRMRHLTCSGQHISDHKTPDIGGSYVHGPRVPYHCFGCKKEVPKGLKEIAKLLRVNRPA